MTQKFANNYKTAVAATFAIGSTNLQVTTGTGAQLEAQTGTLSVSNFCLLTLAKKTAGVETSWEIVKVTGRSGDVFTVVRAQEGTTAVQWEIGEQVEARATRDTLLSMIPSGSITQIYESGDITIVANGTATLSHGMTSVPKIVMYSIRCTGTDGGYSSGDVVNVYPGPTPNSTGFAASYTATDIYYRFYNGTVFALLRKDTALGFFVNNSQWVFNIKAFA